MKYELDLKLNCRTINAKFDALNLNPKIELEYFALCKSFIIDFLYPTMDRY